mgnify:CR=1 FL=1
MCELQGNVLFPAEQRRNLIIFYKKLLFSIPGLTIGGIMCILQS